MNEELMRRKAEQARTAAIAANLRKRGRKETRNPPPEERGEVIPPLELARRRQGIVAPESTPAPAPQPKPEPAKQEAPEVNPVHRGSGRWAAEVNGKPLVENETGEVALFGSKAEALDAGTAYAKALTESLADTPDTIPEA